MLGDARIAMKEPAIQRNLDQIHLDGISSWLDFQGKFLSVRYALVFIEETTKWSDLSSSNAPIALRNISCTLPWLKLRRLSKHHRSGRSETKQIFLTAPVSVPDLLEPTGLSESGTQRRSFFMLHRSDLRRSDLSRTTYFFSLNSASFTFPSPPCGSFPPFEPLGFGPPAFGPD